MRWRKKQLDPHGCNLQWHRATDVRDIPQVSGALSPSQSLHTPTSRFYFAKDHLMAQHSNVWAQIPHLPIQFIACAWKPGAPVLKCHLSQSFSLTSVKDSSVTVRAGQLLCSQPLGAARALPMSWHCSDTHIFIFCYNMYRGNIQGQDQGRSWEHNRQSQKNLQNLCSPPGTASFYQCPRLKQSQVAEYLWAEHESSWVKQPFLGDRIYRAVLALQESSKAVPGEHRFTGSTSFSSWELLAGCGCAFQELSPDQLLRAKSSAPVCKN